MTTELSAPADEPAGPAVDRCPYSRSITRVFADDPPCPAYQGATFTVMDTAHRPLRAALTCRHLTVGNHARGAGRFYPRCGLGGAAERVRWAAAVTPARLAVMRSLEEEFEEATLAERTALSATKARLLGGNPDSAAVENLEVRLSALLDRVDAFIDERAERLADVGLPPARMHELLAEWSMAWLRSNRVYGPGTAVAHGIGVAGAAAALLGAELAGVPSAVPPTGAVLPEAGAAVITRTEHPRTLHLRGEVDVVNAGELATALAAALADGGDVVVDFAEVLFCDLTGLRALVAASETVRAGQHIQVVGLPQHLHRVLRMAGWSGLPGLVIGPPGAAPGPSGG